MGTPSRIRDVLHMADLGRRDRRNVESDYEKGEICRSDICAVGRGRRDGCYVGGYGYSDFRGPAKYQPCQDAYEKVWRDLEWDHPRWDDREMSCDLIPESTRRALQMCPECIDEGSTFVRYDQSCKLSAEHAEKQRKAEEKKRECDRQATEKKNQCLAQPALYASLGIDNDPKTRPSFFSFDRLKGLQKCQDQYAECLTQHADTRYAECLPHHMLGVTISIIHHNHLMNADTAPGKIGGVSNLSEKGYGNRRQRTVDRNVRSPTRLRLVTAID